MSLEQESSMGSQAERILSDVSPYFDMVEAAILDTWKKSPVSDEKGQHELRLMMKLLGDVKANMKTVIETGKLAKAQIERDSLIDKAKNVVRRFA
jgi:hypothetical protein